MMNFVENKHRVLMTVNFEPLFEVGFDERRRVSKNAGVL